MTRRRALAAVALALGTAPRLDACASPCCGGTDLPGFERLKMWESWATGARLGVARSLGSWDAQGTYASNRDYRETVGRAELWGMYGLVADRLSAVVRLPLVETWRTVGDRRDSGGGVGDVTAGLRGAVWRVGEGPGDVGVALIAGLRCGTGRGPDDAKQTLATDVTGRGLWAPSLGVSLERAFGDEGMTFARVDFGVEIPLPSSVGRHEHRAGEGVQGAALLGRALGHGLTLSGVLRYAWENAPIDDGARVPSARAAESAIGVAASLDMTETISIQAGAEAPVALSGAGENRVAALGGTVGIRWGER